MVDRLARTGINVEHRAIALLMDLELLRHLLNNLKHVADQRIILRHKIIQRWNVFPGTNQNMNWRLRTQVSECHYEVILIHKFGGCFTSDDSTEEARLLHDRTLARFDESGNMGSDPSLRNFTNPEIRQRGV